MNEPVWLQKVAILHLHDASVARFGGSEGLRDEGLLESALLRPVNRFSYEDGLDLADLAASYSFALVRNHAFVDGNKRIALLACGVFRDMNGCEFLASNADAYQAIMALAAGQIGELEFAAWLRQNCKIPVSGGRHRK